MASDQTPREVIAEKMRDENWKTDPVIERQAGRLIVALDAAEFAIVRKPTGEMSQISDGYHTFAELYHYRALYNAAAFNAWAREGIHVFKSWRHADGEECFGGGWFIVVAELPTGQISNHYPAKYWNLFQIPSYKTAREWDGHTPAEAADRLAAALAAAAAADERTPDDLDDALNLQKPFDAAAEASRKGRRQ